MEDELGKNSEFRIIQNHEASSHNIFHNLSF